MDNWLFGHPVGVDDHTEHLAELVLTAPSHFNAIETLDWATAQLFLIPTTELDRRRQAIRNQLGDDARVQRQLAYLHESLSIRLRDAYVRRLGIDPADTSDLCPQILVGLYLSLATEVSGRSQSPEETRRRWLASLRSLL